jgi:hypothetical protein
MLGAPLSDTRIISSHAGRPISSRPASHGAISTAQRVYPGSRPQLRVEIEFDDTVYSLHGSPTLIFVAAVSL